MKEELSWRSTKTMDEQQIVSKKYSIFLMYFIMVQPILDLLTAFSMKVLDVNATPGIVIRFFVMVVSALYVLKAARHKENRKYLYYLIVLAFFFIVHLGINYFVKDPVNLFSEIKSIGKIAYFNEMLVVFVLAFKDLARMKKEVREYFPKNIIVAAVIINIVMVITSLTSTGIRSYGALDKVGHSGWFFAANELSTLLAIILPIVIWFVKEKVTNLKNSWWWILSLVTIFSLIAIGTKAGYLATLASLGAFIAGLILEFIFNRKQTRKHYAVNFILGAALLILFFLATPYLPVYNNTHVQYEITKEEINRVDEEETDTTVETPPEESNEVTQPTVDDVVYSGRSGFVQMHKDFYTDAPFVQKVMGMGYAGNYEENPVIIERDFHDIFFQYGWVGFIIITMPIVAAAFWSIYKVLKNLKYFLTVKQISVISSIVLGLGIAYIAGHTLVAPAVSTYLTLIMGYFLVDVERY